MDNVRTALELIGALSAAFTALHMLFPKVAFFQRAGMALRSFGPTDTAEKKP